MINTLFSDMLGKYIYSYLNDLIIGCENWDNHFANLQAVFLKLKEAGLKAKPNKCEFLTAKITFLGDSVERNGVHAMDDKISAIKNWPKPRNVEKVPYIIGLCGY